MALIELRNLHKRFGPLVVLDGVTLSIPEGQSIVIIGASGTGKSVLLKHIVGLLKPDAGQVWFDGRRIDTMKEQELNKVRTEFGFLFQMGALFDSFNVEDNISFPLREHSNKSAEEISQVVDEKLAMVGLPESRKKMPAQLSGGQRKRIALARAIALNPRVILYDEPTTGLDPIRSDVINELILKLQLELKVTSITVTHDMQSAFKIADRIVMLFKGKVIFDGTPDEIQKSQEPRIRSFVTGEAGPEDLEGLQKANRPAGERRSSPANVTAPSKRDDVPNPQRSDLVQAEPATPSSSPAQNSSTQVDQPTPPIVSAGPNGTRVEPIRTPSPNHASQPGPSSPQSSSKKRSKRSR